MLNSATTISCDSEVLSAGDNFSFREKEEIEELLCAKINAFIDHNLTFIQKSEGKMASHEYFDFGRTLLCLGVGFSLNVILSWMFVRQVQSQTRRRANGSECKV